MDFQARGEYKTMLLEKASATVIEAGDLVAKSSSGLAIKATATSTKVAFCPQGAASGALTCEVTVGQVELVGDSSDVFAESQRGEEYDIAVTDGKQTINQSGTTYKVLMMDESQDAGTVGAATSVKVRINKPISERA